LEQLDPFLAANDFQRVDVSLARRFDLDDPEQEYPLELVHDRGKEAVDSGRPCFGIFVIAEETAEFADSEPT
jgi:hypothetical protein